MENLIFKRALKSEMPRIIAMESDIFSREQGLPCDDVEEFMGRDPIFWCAEYEGKIYAAVAAWKEKDGRMHWGRFVVFPDARGRHIGTRLARYSFAQLFEDGVDEVHMNARDVTVKIVCDMGGEVVGETTQFFGRNITPVVLKKEDFINTGVTV